MGHIAMLYNSCLIGQWLLQYVVLGRLQEAHAGLNIPGVVDALLGKDYYIRAPLTSWI